MSSAVKIPHETLLEICGELGVLMPNTTYFYFMDTDKYLPVRTFFLSSDPSDISFEVTGDKRFQDVIEEWWKEMFAGEKKYVSVRRTISIIEVNSNLEIERQLLFRNAEPSSTTLNADEFGYYEAEFTAQYYEQII